MTSITLLITDYIVFYIATTCRQVARAVGQNANSQCDAASVAFPRQRYSRNSATRKKLTVHITLQV